MSSPEWIHVSDHAAERWRDRRGDVKTGARVAWNDAVPVDLEQPNGRARYHPEADVVLVVKSPFSTLVTILRGEKLPGCDRATLASEGLRPADPDVADAAEGVEA